MVACVLAANMSSCSNLMVNSGALFTRNLWLTYSNPSANDRQLLWAGRLSGLVLTAAAILFALMVGNVLQAFLFMETLAALFGVMFLGGILWRRANRFGAGAATLVAFLSYYAALYLTTCAPGTAARPVDLSVAFARLFASADGWAHLQTGQWMLVYKWLPGPFGFAMLLSFSTLIIVSLLTKPEDSVRLEAFFDRMRRSTDRETPPTANPNRWPPTAARSCSCSMSAPGLPPPAGEASSVATAKTWSAFSCLGRGRPADPVGLAADADWEVAAKGPSA